MIAEFLDGYAFGISAVGPNLSYHALWSTVPPCTGVLAVHVKMGNGYVKQKCLQITVPDLNLAEARMTTKLQHGIPLYSDYYSK